jgi:transcriptional regulator with XRE-family HTH domain
MHRSVYGPAYNKFTNAGRLRIAVRLTQAKLTERMGVDRGYISGIEEGER